MEKIVVGTCNNELALKQGYALIERLKAQGLRATFEIKTIHTSATPVVPYYERHLFPSRKLNFNIQHSLKQKEIDLAVFPLTDASLYLQDCFVLATFPKRMDSRHAYIGRTHIPLDQLPEGAIIGTVNPRVSAFLKATYPHLSPVVMEQFIHSEIEQLRRGAYDGIILSVMDLTKLNLLELITQYIEVETLLPEVAQGALAVKCRSNDRKLIEMLQTINDEETAINVKTEREFVRLLDEDYIAPISAYATTEAKEITLQGSVCAIDGTELLKVNVTGNDPEEVAKKAVDEALSQGAGDMIERAKEALVLQYAHKFQ